MIALSQTGLWAIAAAGSIAFHLAVGMALYAMPMPERASTVRTEINIAAVPTGDSQPAMADSRMMDWIDQTAASLKLPSQRMPSGAGHDAQEVAHIAPMAMIFVPSVGGISHSPREFTKADDVANGVDVLLNAVVRADRE